MLVGVAGLEPATPSFEGWCSIRLSYAAGRLGAARRFVPRSRMTNDNPTHPFTLTILPNPMLSGHFDWAIRKHGTLAERSDRPHPSEQSARKSGEAALERHVGGDREPMRAFPFGRRKRR